MPVGSRPGKVSYMTPRDSPHTGPGKIAHTLAALRSVTAISRSLPQSLDHSRFGRRLGGLARDIGVDRILHNVPGDSESIIRRLATIAAPALSLNAHAAEDETGAASASDFAASKGAGAEAQLRERLRARVRTIPGTETQYFIGGYLQLDGIATRRKQDGDEQDTFIVSTTPFVNLLHRLTPTLAVGAEVLWGEASRVDGATATNLRLQVSVRYLIS